MDGSINASLLLFSDLRESLNQMNGSPEDSGSGDAENTTRHRKPQHQNSQGESSTTSSSSSGGSTPVAKEYTQEQLQAVNR